MQKKTSQLTNQKVTTRTVPKIQMEEIELKEGEIIEITPDMIIGDVAIAYPVTLEIFKKAGIHCVGCYASTFESIQEGTQKHGLDPEKICKSLNKIIQTSSNKKS